MNILYLYSEIGPYNIPVFSCLTKSYRAKVHVVHWDRKALTPYVPPPIDDVVYYERSQYSTEQILELAQTIAPDLVYIAGWMDRGYLPTARRFCARGTPVVTGFDDQWAGSMRQRLGTIAFRLHYRHCFTHAWVAGPRQYEFAKRLGFDDDHVLFDLLTCNYPLFDEVGKDLNRKSSHYPKTFLYVGRLTRQKGIDVLVKAFRKYRELYRGEWKLICVGNGEMRQLLELEPAIEVMDYMDQRELAALCGNAGVFILPSRSESWGVVVHECAAAGLPLLLSDTVGAKALFLIEGFNGMTFSNESPDELSRAMAVLSGKADWELCEMGQQSRTLAGRITPATSAASLVSIILGRRR